MRKLAHLCHLAFVIRFAERLPFVIGVLTLTERYFHLRQPPLVDEQAQRNDGLAVVLCGFLEFVDLAALQQQFAVATHLMVGKTAETVLRDMHLFDV